MFLLMAGLAPASTLAANYYVRAGAPRDVVDGKSWETAYLALPPNLVRGATYYVAGVAGVSYPGYTFDDPVNATLPIIIKKANAQDNGGEPDWDPSYATTAARWQPLDIMTSYIIFDGVTRNAQSGFGFEIYSEANGLLLNIGNSAHDVTVQNTELHFSTWDMPDDFRSDAIYGNTIGKATPCNKITIRNCYIHDVPGCPLLMRYWTNLLFENNWVARNRSTAVNHSEGVSTHGGGNFIFRNNVWQDIEGTAVIVNLYATTRNWQIYGNIFIQTDNPAVDGLGHGIVSDNFRGSDIIGLQFYNNTIVGQHGGASGLQFWSNGSTNLWAYNNLWFNCKEAAFNKLVYDYNTFIDCEFAFNYTPQPHDTQGSGDPFVNAAAMDSHLLTSTPDGFPLQTGAASLALGATGEAPRPPVAAGAVKGGSRAKPPTNMIIAPQGAIDPDGKPRGGDGHWDRGAYEYTQPTQP